jgi:hypothetical protein
MATTEYTLNIDHWDWVDPETQKVTRLRRGDTVPVGVVNQEGVDKDEVTKGSHPVFLTVQVEKEETPKRVESK